MKNDADSLLMQSIDYTYSIEYEDAIASAKELQRRYPEHPAGYFAESICYWWQILLEVDNLNLDGQFLNSIDRVISVCDNVLDTNSWDLVHLFFKGGAIGYRGRYYAQRENWISTASDGLAAYKILHKCLEIAPMNKDILLGIGYYNYFSKVFPERYPALKPLMSFAPVGNKYLGMLQIKSVAKNAKYSGLEAQVMLLQIYFMFEKDFYEALKIAEELHKKFPNNPYFHKYYGRTLVSTGSRNYANVWLNILNRCRKKQKGYDVRVTREGMYYFGSALFNDGFYSRAVKYLLKAEEISRNIDKEITGFLAQTCLKIGKIYDIQKNRKKALEYYRKVASWKDFNGSKSDAEYYLKNVYGS